jgi:putative sigma-54 modulation protein
VHVEISGHHHVTITDGVRSHIQEKADHLARIFDGFTTLHVAFDLDSGDTVAEFTANLSHGAPVVAKGKAATLHAAIELAADKVAAQLRRHKEKVRDRRTRPSKATPPPEAPGEEESDTWETNEPAE